LGQAHQQQDKKVLFHRFGFMNKKLGTKIDSIGNFFHHSTITCAIKRQFASLRQLGYKLISSYFNKV